MAAPKYRGRQFINPLNRNIGRRTGRNIKAGKNIRIREDGFENFDDYLSESDADVTREVHHLRNITEETESGTGSSSQEETSKENAAPPTCFPAPPPPGNKTGETEPHHQSTTLSSTMSATQQSMLSQNCTVDPLHKSKFGWLKNRNIGRRTGRDVKANKKIRVDVNGMENFDDYFSESDTSSFFSQSSHFSSPSSAVRKPRRSHVQEKAAQRSKENHTVVETSDDDIEYSEDYTQSKSQKPDSRQQRKHTGGDAEEETTLQNEKGEGVTETVESEADDEGSQESQLEADSRGTPAQQGSDRRSMPVHQGPDSRGTPDYQGTGDHETGEQDNAEHDTEEHEPDDHDTEEHDTEEHETEKEDTSKQTVKQETDNDDTGEKENIEYETEDKDTVHHDKETSTEESQTDRDGEEVDDASDGNAQTGKHVTDGKHNNGEDCANSGSDSESRDDDENKVPSEAEEESGGEQKDGTVTENHEQYSSESEADEKEDKLPLADISRVSAVIADDGEVQPSQSQSGIDVAGNRSGSITKRGIPLQQASTVNFNRTKKRLSYSALELSAEGKKARRSRIERANQELQKDNTPEDSIEVTETAKSKLDKSVSKATKSIVNKRVSEANKSIVNKKVAPLEDDASESSANSFVCLAFKSKLVKTDETINDSDGEDICIVEEEKVKQKNTKHDTKETKSQQHVAKEGHVSKKSIKRPKSEMKSRKAVSGTKARRKTTRGSIKRSTRLGSMADNEQDSMAIKNTSTRKTKGTCSSKIENDLDILHDVYDMDTLSDDSDDNVNSYISLGRTPSRVNEVTSVSTLTLAKVNVDGAPTCVEANRKQNIGDKTEEDDDAGNADSKELHSSKSSREKRKSGRRSSQLPKMSSSTDEESNTMNKQKSVKASLKKQSIVEKDHIDNTEQVKQHSSSSKHQRKSGRKSSQRSKVSTSSEEESDSKNKHKSLKKLMKTSVPKQTNTEQADTRCTSRHTRSSASEEEKTGTDKHAAASEITSKSVKSKPVSKRKSSSDEDNAENETCDISPINKSRSVKNKATGKNSISTPSKKLLLSKPRTTDTDLAAEDCDHQDATGSSSISVKGRRVAKRKSSSEEEHLESEKTNVSLEKQIRSLRSKAKKNENRSLHNESRKKKTKSLSSDDERSVPFNEDCPADVDSSGSATPKPDATVTAPSHFGSGVSFRVSRRSELLENVQSGCIGNDAVQVIQMEATSSLTPCISRPGRSRKRKERRVTICPEENVQHDYSRDNPEEEAPGQRPGVVTKRLFRHSAGMSDTPLPSPSSTPIHAFETTNNNSPADDWDAIPSADRLIFPEPAPDGLRRSCRTRVKPLKPGERLIFDNTNPSGPLIVGVQPSVVEKERRMQAEKRKRRMLLYQIRRAARAEQADRRPARKLSIHTELPENLAETDNHYIAVINISSQEIDGVECVSKRDSRQAVGPDHGSPRREDPYLITQLVDQPMMSAGLLELRPRAEKPTQMVECDAVMFNVKYGKLLVTIHETTTLVETDDTFFVPIGNTYSLKNLRVDTARLFYVVLKPIREIGEQSIHYHSLRDDTRPQQQASN